MSRPSAESRQKSILVALWIFAGCLAVHFIAEDLAYLAFTSHHPVIVSNTANLSELTHQDDLAQTPQLPSMVAAGDPPAVTTAIIPTPFQASYPIRLPPKI